MTTKPVSLLALAAILLLSVTSANAEKFTVEAAIPWEGKGRIFQINSTTVQFLGVLEGIMYVENSKGEMHEAFVQCPIVQHLKIDTGTSDATGNCEITAGPNDVVYAQLSCKGRVGDCAGKFVLVEGEGKFTGISGEGDLRVRSPLRALAGSLGSGDAVRVASGLATIRNMEVTKP